MSPDDRQTRRHGHLKGRPSPSRGSALPQFLGGTFRLYKPSDAATLTATYLPRYRTFPDNLGHSGEVALRARSPGPPAFVVRR